jgi:hypothetical protein
MYVKRVLRRMFESKGKELKSGTKELQNSNENYVMVKLSLSLP